MKWLLQWINHSWFQKRKRRKDIQAYFQRMKRPSEMTKEELHQWVEEEEAKWKDYNNQLM